MGLIYTRASTAGDRAAGELIKGEAAQLRDARTASNAAKLADQSWYRRATVGGAIASSFARRAVRQDRQAGKP
jgi:hypothetical protein